MVSPVSNQATDPPPAAHRSAGRGTFGTPDARPPAVRRVFAMIPLLIVIDVRQGLNMFESYDTICLFIKLIGLTQAG